MFRSSQLQAIQNRCQPKVFDRVNNPVTPIGATSLGYFYIFVPSAFLRTLTRFSGRYFCSGAAHSVRTLGQHRLWTERARHTT